MPPLFRSLLIVVSLLVTRSSFAENQVLDDQMHHLRMLGLPREWSDFPETAAAEEIAIAFQSKANTSPQSLRIRQVDVKQRWLILLNGEEIGRLRIDENDLIEYHTIPPGKLRDGENRLVIQQDRFRQKVPDDIRLGEIEIDDRPLDELLSEATVEIQVTDESTQQMIPARITILDPTGGLQTVGASSSDHLAVRPGIVYTSTGQAQFGLPHGSYTIYAGRGFEYSLAETSVKLAPGTSKRIALTLKREVNTTGYVACDTHVHTLTHSGHGDTTVQERMITLAAEGIELPIATDHNVHIDHRPFVEEMKVGRYLTPVIGNEVTTRIGHFNVFPAAAQDTTVPDFKQTEWKGIFDSIYGTPGIQIAILNHGRDEHSGTTPLGPKLYNAAAGRNIQGWKLEANGMELVNSAATQADPTQLTHDWMTLLNSGHDITPVGASDSHDVGRHFVGQGRTYIQCPDGNPGAIDVKHAVQSFLDGRVMVSYGLIAQLEVDGKYVSGDLVPAAGQPTVSVRAKVLGPQWVSADRIELYANGVLIQEQEITTASKDGVIWEGSWSVPVPKHDVHLVALATGPGVESSYWKTSKSYKPTSPDWTARVLGCSGAIWLDSDGDGTPAPARSYAEQLVEQSKGDLETLLASLSSYDEAVAIQAADLYQLSGNSLKDSAAQALIQKAPAVTRSGFEKWIAADAECETAQVSN